jgi:4-carboxymuconolactone decarboxylase
VTQAPAAGSPQIEAVSPALNRYIFELLFGEVWKRPVLSARDRGLATVAALISRNHATALPSYLGRALDNGVTPTELSETITHLAFYCGFPNAMVAVRAAEPLFKERGIDAAQLIGRLPELEPCNAEAEAEREAMIRSNFASVSQGVVDYTEMLFMEVWRRPGLAPRDRSLVTVSALIAAGQSAQITFHLNRAMDNGLTQPEAGELLTHLAFYAGWPNIFSAMPVAKGVFEQRNS